jgi:DNA-binding transcriptional ArsR family regulator
METQTVVDALHALAQPTRLEVFRLLVQRGPTGACAGEITRMLDLAPATLSFHLNALQQAGLIICTRTGRVRQYHAALDRMNALVDYLTENCCGGADCRPTKQKASA